MTLRDILHAGRFCLSIEIFPPKTPEGDAALWENLDHLVRFQPAFISCTYGAGGSTRTRTVELCQQIHARYGVPATAHFTCVGSARGELRDWLQLASRAGVRNFMALRGDPPRGHSSFQAAPGGLKYAAELVSLIREDCPEAGIGVAGYPEKHPEAPSLEVDLAHLRTKVAAGADAVFTQLFFVNESFLRFRDRCTALGITKPIIPGVMPITEFARIKRITEMCGAVLPAALVDRLSEAQDDLAAQFEIGVEWAIEQCRALQAAGVPGIHFYALNKSPACERILRELSLPARG